MAVHAGLGRRDARERRLLDRRMAVAAVEADAADVMRVAELERLLDELVLLGGPGRAHQGEARPSPTSDDEPMTPARAHTGEGVGTAGKNLAHRRQRERPKPTLISSRLHTPTMAAPRVERPDGAGFDQEQACGRHPGGRRSRRRLYNVKRFTILSNRAGNASMNAIELRDRHARRSARTRPSATSRSTCPKAASTASSVRTAPARRRRSG